MWIARTGTFGFAALLLAAFPSCAGDSPPTETLGTHEGALTAGTPIINFDVNAPRKSWIALTFDDGPDDQGYTDAILDILAAHGAKATFFVCSDAIVHVSSSWRAQRTLARMVADGHEVGSHTAHHANLGDPSVDVDAELKPVDDMLARYAYDPGNFAYRVARAPYGNPWFGPQSRLDVVAPIIAEYGVHIGWNIDSQDSTTCTTATCVSNNVLSRVDAGRSGIVLMHSISAWSVKALPTILTGLESRGKQLVLVEDLVLAKYGKPSRQLFTCSGSWQCVAEEYCSTKTHHCTPRSTSSGVADAGPADTGVDAGSAPMTADTGIDSGGAPLVADAGIDAGHVWPLIEAGSADSGAIVVGIDSAAPTDTGALDTGAFDTGTLDTGTPDTWGLDAGTPGTGALDAGTPDTDEPDLGTADDATTPPSPQEVGTDDASVASVESGISGNPCAPGTACTSALPDAGSDPIADVAPANDGACSIDRRPTRPTRDAGALVALLATVSVLTRRRRRGA